nr:MAG TPA: hypothetical protein [Bacteriophage sp.]
MSDSSEIAFVLSLRSKKEVVKGLASTVFSSSPFTVFTLPLDTSYIFLSIELMYLVASLTIT